MDKKLDKTHLSLDQAEKRGFLHRDYIAHCLRWSHVVKYIGQQKRYVTARILDIGCGKETPLIKTLYTSRMTPLYYMGVDANTIPKNEIHEKISDKMGRDNFVVRGSVDFTSTLSEEELLEIKPTVITCFEVLEHNSPDNVIAILQNIKKVSSDTTRIFISTPCFNGSAAANHINEMTKTFMDKLFVEYGFNIIGCYGTFASQVDIEPVIRANGDNELTYAYEKLKKYYDSNLISVMFAPLFPNHSRNCLWELQINS